MSVNMATGTRPAQRPAAWIAATAAAAVLWFAIYSQLEGFSAWTVSLLALPPGGRLEEAARFFVYDTPKVLMLLNYCGLRHGGDTQLLFTGAHTRPARGQA